jgi:hypothetical protein
LWPIAWRPKQATLHAYTIALYSSLATLSPSFEEDRRHSALHIHRM